MKFIRYAMLLVSASVCHQAGAQSLSEYEALELVKYTPLEKEKWFEEQKPLKLRVNGGVTYESNLLRLSDDVSAASVGASQKDDLIYRVGLGAKYDLQASRQKFVLEANATEYKYQNLDNLDNTSDDLRGEWQWQAGNNWNGTLGLGQRRYLESFSNVQQYVRDMVNQDRVYGSANYLVYSRLRLTADASYYDTQHGDASRSTINSQITNLGFMVNWVTPALNTIGLRYRTSDARYPNNESVGSVQLQNAYRDDEISVVARYIASGLSELSARIGYTKREFDERPSRDYSSPTWRLSYLWRATGKTTVDFSTWRSLEPFEDLTQNYIRDTGISVAPALSITPQVVLQAKVTYETRKYVGDPGFVPITTQREDKDRTVQLIALWTPLRLTELSLGLEAGRRTSNQTFADFNYESVSLGIARYF